MKLEPPSRPRRPSVAAAAAPIRARPEQQGGRAGPRPDQPGGSGGRDEHHGLDDTKIGPVPEAGEGSHDAEPVGAQQCEEARR